MLASLIPERVGSLLSLNSLREDLEVSYDTVKRWLGMLWDLYYIFRILNLHQPGKNFSRCFPATLASS